MNPAVEQEFRDVHTQALTVEDAVNTRHSIRDFESKAVPEAVLQKLFEDSLRAPSWKNSQPWRVHVVTGERRDRMARLLMEAAATQTPSPDTAWPAAYPSDAKKRMFELGMQIYGVAGIDRKDKAARDDFMLRNFGFFGAPVAAFITTDFDPGFYVGVDIGCYLNTLMLLARSHGLGTCPQAALSAFPGVVRQELGLAQSERVVCGISLGYAKADSTLNRFHTPRAETGALLKFY